MARVSDASGGARIRPSAGAPVPGSPVSRSQLGARLARASAWLTPSGTGRQNGGFPVSRGRAAAGEGGGHGQREQQRRRHGQQRHRAGRAPALRRRRNRVDQEKQRPGHGDGAERVKAAAGPRAGLGERCAARAATPRPRPAR